MMDESKCLNYCFDFCLTKNLIHITIHIYISFLSGTIAFKKIST
ncbi:Uncharacterized protein dnm_011930 [Desulfonema magnum]|uniref:Uncharacterized protein n=1 Tax=Desulfonema magnum TaxID=45655 RepID=A0A975BH37_9BACT|nr:Uncharacterized protein dnm_011930 [Desulfonema magnum]